MKNQNQIWFLVAEEMDSMNFKQVQHTLQEIWDQGISFESILKDLEQTEPPANFAFFLHSPSMAASVRMLKDEEIHAMWQLYCGDDPTVTITIRRIHDPSPNRSRAPSYDLSLAQRRTAAGSLPVAEVAIQTPPRSKLTGQDVFTLVPMESFSEEELVTVILATGEHRTFSKEYLTETLAWTTQNGRAVSTKLSRDVWERSLVRGPWKDSFVGFWEKSLEISGAREVQLMEIRRLKPNFEQSCKAFIYDLQTCQDEGPHQRLDQTGHRYYLGPPYFDADTAAKLLNLPTYLGTLENDLRQLVGTGETTEVCAPSELAPIMGNALNMLWDPMHGRIDPIHDHRTPIGTGSRGTMKKIAHKASKLFTKKKGEEGGPSGSSGHGGPSGSSGHGATSQGSRG